MRQHWILVAALIAVACGTTVVAPQAKGTVFRTPEGPEIGVRCWHCGEWVKISRLENDLRYRPSALMRCPNCHSLMEVPRLPWPVLDGHWHQIGRLSPEIRSH